MGLYRLLTNLAGPFIGLFLRLRQWKGKEDAERFQERLGFPSKVKKAGPPLLWCHAASVGESMSVLALLKALQTLYPQAQILVTSGTVTSARLLERALPEGIQHQYAPVDRWPYVTRFLDYWEPAIALWVESELWPNMLGALKERGIPAILLNGRMSERSYRRWRMIPEGARNLLSAFALGLVQTGVEANRFEALGLSPVHVVGNLKYAADPLACDLAALEALQNDKGHRPAWLVASTHPGEEEIALRVHKRLSLTFPDILTIIVPRHPHRADAIGLMAQEERLSTARRSKDEPLTTATAIYLADTMGELGLFYRLCPLVCLAGSFTWGGHNPVEPAQLGCCVLFGPRMDHFLVMADDMLAHHAAKQVLDEEELYETLVRLLAHPEEASTIGQKAHAWTEQKKEILKETLELAKPLLSRHLLQEPA